MKSQRERLPNLGRQPEGGGVGFSPRHGTRELGVLPRGVLGLAGALLVLVLAQGCLAPVLLPGLHLGLGFQECGGHRHLQGRDFQNLIPELAAEVRLQQLAYARDVLLMTGRWTLMISPNISSKLFVDVHIWERGRQFCRGYPKVDFCASFALFQVLRHLSALAAGLLDFAY